MTFRCLRRWPLVLETVLRSACFKAGCRRRTNVACLSPATAEHTDHVPNPTMTVRRATQLRMGLPPHFLNPRHCSSTFRPLAGEITAGNASAGRFEAEFVALITSVSPRSAQTTQRSENRQQAERQDRGLGSAFVGFGARRVCSSNRTVARIAGIARFRVVRRASARTTTTGRVSAAIDSFVRARARIAVGAVGRAAVTIVRG